MKRIKIDTLYFDVDLPADAVIQSVTVHLAPWVVEQMQKKDAEDINWFGEEGEE